ncbi:MAG: hypothetical protein H0W75_01000 [Chitinophagaceae bacterium]|nr:hypothetical protein [Chitinophagaceae bacterium]
MESKAQIPFQHLLKLVKTLSPVQKAKLKQELIDNKKAKPHSNTRFTRLLLSGPVFTYNQIKTIKENRKSISKWRTKS